MTLQPSPQKPTLKLADVFNLLNTFFHSFISNWKTTLVITTITVLSSIGYFFWQKPAYEGVSTFILEEKSGSGSGLAGIASQFGIDISGISGGSGIFAGDNILDIIKSRQIIEKVLLSNVDNKSNKPGITLADLFLEMLQWKKKWQHTDPELATINFYGLTPQTTHTIPQDSVLYLIYDKIIKKYVSVERLNKKGSIIRVSTQSTNPVFSKLLTERLVQETRKLYIEIKTANLQANVNRLEGRSDSLLTILNARTFQTVNLQSLDANPAYRNASGQIEVSQRDKSVAAAIYAEVVKNLEMSKIALSQQTPVIQLLDTPKYPLQDHCFKLEVLLLIGLAVGLALGAFLSALSLR